MQQNNVKKILSAGNPTPTSLHLPQFFDFIGFFRQSINPNPTPFPYFCTPFDFPTKHNTLLTIVKSTITLSEDWLKMVGERQDCGNWPQGDTVKCHSTCSFSLEKAETALEKYDFLYGCNYRTKTGHTNTFKDYRPSWRHLYERLENKQIWPLVQSNKY